MTCLRLIVARAAEVTEVNGLSNMQTGSEWQAHHQNPQEQETARSAMILIPPQQVASAGQRVKCIAAKTSAASMWEWLHSRAET